MIPENLKLLERGIEQLGIAHSADKINLMGRFLDELLRWNARFGFMKADERELVVNHTLDTLSGLPVLLEHGVPGVLADIGSGAGFPGIPLALFLPDTDVHLCERMARRAVFLKNASLLLGLKRVSVYEKDLADMDASCDVVTFRAFSKISTVIEPLMRLVGPGGVLFAYKARLEHVREEQAELEAIGMKVDVRAVQVPFLDAERHIMIVKRNQAT